MKEIEPVFPVAERITYLREKCGLSINKLANRAGVSQSYLRDVELGNKNPTINFICLLCNTLSISVKDFFDLESSPNVYSDPLFLKIQQMSPSQKEALYHFISSMQE